MNNYPAGVTSATIDRHFGSPDEPDHPTQCRNCNRFLRRAGWEYETDRDEEGCFLVWFTRCRSCGTMNSDR